MYSNVLIFREKNWKKLESNVKNNTKRVMYFVRLKYALFSKHSLLVILQNDLPSQKHLRRQIILALECINSNLIHVSGN